MGRSETEDAQKLETKDQKLETNGGGSWFLQRTAGRSVLMTQMSVASALSG